MTQVLLLFPIDGLFPNLNPPARGAKAAAQSKRLFPRNGRASASGILLGCELLEKKDGRLPGMGWRVSFQVQSRYGQRNMLGPWASSVKVYGKARPWVECKPHPRGF